MENINIQELAKTVGRTQKEVIDYCNKKGIAVENGNVPNEIAEKIKKGMSTEAPKKKKAVVFRPQNSSQPLPQKKKTVKKPAVSKEEDAKRTESTAVRVEKSQPVADNKQQETKMREEKQQEPVKKKTGKREDNRNQKRVGGQ